MKFLTVKKLAEAAAVNIETIRYYEREKVMPKPDRASNGYRRYTGYDVERLKFIQRAKDLGFTLKEVSELLSLYEDPDSCCADVHERANEKLVDIEARIADLVGMRDVLRELVGGCPADETNASDCVILAHLNGMRAEVEDLKRQWAEND